MKLCRRITLLLSSSLILHEACAFSVKSWRQQPLNSTKKRGSPSSLLMAEKKRRRRKDSSSVIVPTPSAYGDELPEFDDLEDTSIAEPATKTSAPTIALSSTTSSESKQNLRTQIKRGSGLNAQLAEELGGNIEGLDEDLILESMRGKAGGDDWQPPRSIQETLGDRSLEKFMNFEKMIEQDGGGGNVINLPEFDDVIARRKQREGGGKGLGGAGGGDGEELQQLDTDGMGKKATRNAQRKAAAMQREAEIESQKSPFEGVNILKLLENGAWVGIGLLVLWELYINSPFFERAAPLIPVVYENVPPGM